MNTWFTVRDKTLRHRELADLITGILRTVALAMEQATGLALGAHVRYRPLSPRAWRHEQSAHQQRCLARDIADLVNQVCKDWALLPAKKEIADPAAWIRRVEEGFLGA